MLFDIRFNKKGYGMGGYIGTTKKDIEYLIDSVSKPGVSVKREIRIKPLHTTMGGANILIIFIEMMIDCFPYVYCQKKILYQMIFINGQIWKRRYYVKPFLLTLYAKAMMDFVKCASFVNWQKKCTKNKTR